MGIPGPYYDDGESVPSGSLGNGLVGGYSLSANSRHWRLTQHSPLWADCVEKLFLFRVLNADSISALMQGIYRDDGTEAGSASSVVLRVLA